jgi:hypothetical protein
MKRNYRGYTRKNPKREDRGMRAWLLIIGLILMGALAGCAGNTGLVEQEWGVSYKLAIANQTLNPDAEKNLKPVSGMDNMAADKVIKKYDKEFDKAPQVPVYSMGTSGGLGTTATTGAGTQY